MRPSMRSSRPTWNATRARARSLPADSPTQTCARWSACSRERGLQTAPGASRHSRHATRFGKDWRYPITSAVSGRILIQESAQMKKIEAVIKPFKLDEVREALSDVGVTGLDRDRGWGLVGRKDTWSSIGAPSTWWIFCPRSRSKSSWLRRRWNRPSRRSSRPPARARSAMARFSRLARGAGGPHPYRRGQRSRDLDRPSARD